MVGQVHRLRPVSSRFLIRPIIRATAGVVPVRFSFKTGLSLLSLVVGVLKSKRAILWYFIRLVLENRIPPLLRFLCALLGGLGVAHEVPEGVVCLGSAGAVAPKALLSHHAPLGLWNPSRVPDVPRGMSMRGVCVGSVQVLVLVSTMGHAA